MKLNEKDIINVGLGRVKEVIDKITLNKNQKVFTRFLKLEKREATKSLALHEFGFRKAYAVPYKIIENRDTIERTTPVWVSKREPSNKSVKVDFYTFIHHSVVILLKVDYSDGTVKCTHRVIYSPFDQSTYNVENYLNHVVHFTHDIKLSLDYVVALRTRLKLFMNLRNKWGD